MERVSHRWHEAILAWLDRQWNEPDRHDHYLMAVRATLTDKKGATLDDFKLKFEQRKEAAKVSPEQELAWSKAFWTAVVQAPGKVPHG